MTHGTSTIAPPADRWLAHAADHVFSCGVGDAAEQLCRVNMTFGLAKIHFAERRLGLPESGLFIGAPDATVTRNSRRWLQGFGYGGQLRWNPALAVLDSKPNGCGMLLARPAARPDEAQVRSAARAARQHPPILDGVQLRYDLDESNHFADALELEQVLPDGAGTDLPTHLIIVHSSGHEHRSSSPFGPGLYYDQSPELQRQLTTMETPWGPLSLLRDEPAAVYHAFCRRVQRFNESRREVWARALFGELTSLGNITHQGLRAPGILHLGATWFEPQDDDGLLPLTLGPHQPVYLLRPRPNFSQEVMARLGWLERAERLGVTSALASANLLPHGGGYAYPDVLRLLRVEQQGARRLYVLDRGPQTPPLAVEDLRPLPFAFRDLAVLQRLVDLELAVPVARYRIRFVVRD